MALTLDELKAHRIDPFSLLSDDERRRLLRAAETDVSILLTGETGTGKGQLARAVAAKSRRPGMIEVNCAALPDELLGSELFGHRRGAYTGAVADRKGILMAASGRTVFLDEIGEISLQMQRMLLRIVQRSRRSIKPLGADEEEALPPMRFIFATNRELEKECREGRFREDLLRRIDVVTIAVPPLRSRPDLIPSYIARFLKELSELHRIKVGGIDRRAVRLLTQHYWPGNVRELKNVLERALVTAPREKAVVIRPDDLRLHGVPDKAVAQAREGSEARELKRALERSRGSIAGAMQILGLASRSSLYHRLRKHGIRVERYSRETTH